ncbi:hypothetical protein WICPIJ_007949 [Wickerhamomyces pijperi]|uniref:DNA mismatch repair protein MSH2 n=1 Tax=Wickerhamomyces pijperi TaxID=599730 RepID=A0A9P8Q1L2_WICPI|nr:hypothetical protein WICPIJ_007949 [Wickerhamomyces pijperi]
MSSSSRPELKFTDTTDERSFYRKFNSLPDVNNSKLIRVLDRGEYYTVFNDDAYRLAQLVFKTTSVIKESKEGSNVKYLTLSPANLGQILTELLVQSNEGFKFEIYDKSLQLLRLATPGNLTSVEDLINMNGVTSGSCVLALKVNQVAEGRSIGFSFIDIQEKCIIIDSLLDNELYSNLESLLIQVDAKEVLITTPVNDSDPDYLKLTGVIDRCDVPVTELKASDFSGKDVEQDLSRLLADELSLSISDAANNTIGLGCCSAVMKYLGLLSDDANYGKYDLRSHSLEQFMKLDSSAVKALNLFAMGKSSTVKNSNIFDLLNHCKSISGSRLLHQWIKQPLLNHEDIKKRQDLVGLFMEDTQLRVSLQDDMLCSVPDLRKLMKRLSKLQVSNLEDVVRIYQFLLKVPEIIEALEMKHQELTADEPLQALIKDTYITPLTEQFAPLQKLQELVETTVDLDALDRHEYVIQPSYDPKLQQYRDRLDELKQQIETIHLSVADDLGLDAEKKLKLESHVNHGWCLRLTRTEERAIRGNKQYIELQTVKAGVFFTTSELKSASSESFTLTKEYSRQQLALVKEIINITSTYAPVLDKIAHTLSHLDVIVSFAHVSSYAPMPYVKPLLYPIGSKEAKVSLENSRHPCVEMQDDIQFIANSFSFRKNSNEFQIITGPNMGGKSTYIRQLGSIALMAQIGCFIPADSGAELPIFDSILSRVGAGDSQLKGVSTFMVEMLETSSILKQATENSLIIIDELGRGTSTYDGFGLAWAISEHIASKIKCFCLFATHFHELTKLSEKVNTVSNLHVVAHVEGGNAEVKDQDNITLLYKVEPGISDQSFGIHVAEVVKFPSKLISMAKRKAAELEEFNGTLSQDNYVQDKRVKCSKEEIKDGTQLLKTVLKQWREECLSKSLNNNEAVERLRELMKVEYKDQIESSGYIQEIMQTL